MENTNSNGYQGVIRLLNDHPDWAPVVVAALECAATTKGGFAGAWVLKIAKRRGVPWIPGLRKLVAYGILVKDGQSTRGGRRAYYIMPDMDGVERALSEMRNARVHAPYQDYEVTDGGISRLERVRVPFFANLASCGGPNMSDAHIDDYFDIDARIATPGGQYYLVRADGDSMNQAGINSGDLVLVRMQNYADIGQKVVVCLSDGVTIKEYQRRGQYTVLVPRSDNPDNKPIVLMDNAEIQGVVVATIPGFK